CRRLRKASGNAAFRLNGNRATAATRRMVMNASTKPEARRASIDARRNPESAEAILTAAEAILREQGRAGCSVEALWRRARAGKRTIYGWCRTKTELLLGVYERQETGVRSVDT